MSQPPIKWGKLKKYLTRNGYEIDTDGGDKIISKGGRGKTHRIGHNYCSHYGDQLTAGHIKALERKFGITRKDILGGK
jgi:hypothetical protein